MGGKARYFWIGMIVIAELRGRTAGQLESAAGAAMVEATSRQAKGAGGLNPSGRR
jgi:hypothetical protein